MSQFRPWIIIPAIESHFGTIRWNILCVKYSWQLGKFPFWQIVLTSKCCRPTFLSLRWCGIGATTYTYQTAYTTSIMFSSSYPWNFTKSVTYAAAQRTHADNDIRIDTTVQMKINKKNIFCLCGADITSWTPFIAYNVPKLLISFVFRSSDVTHGERTLSFFLYILESGRKLKQKCELVVLLFSSVFFGAVAGVSHRFETTEPRRIFFNFSSGFRLQKFPNNKNFRLLVENFRELDTRLIVNFGVCFSHQKSELTHPKCRRHF